MSIWAATSPDSNILDLVNLLNFALNIFLDGEQYRIYHIFEAKIWDSWTLVLFLQRAQLRKL